MKKLDDDELARVKRHVVEDLLRLSEATVTQTLLGATAAAVLYPFAKGAGRFALWLVGAGIDTDLAYAITKSLWSEATGRLMAALPAGQRIDLDRALAGLSVPLHPGAERFYREAGKPVGDAPRIKEAEETTK